MEMPERPDGSGAPETEGARDATLTDTGGGTSATRETRGFSGPMRVEMPPLARGDHIGRYIVLDVLGRGGMGIVYKAYDPDLDRRVALKLLRPRMSTAESSSSGRERLVREAQALAQLSHPNVVTVYDVGTIDDDVFVAMELVEGRDLRGWLAEERRSARDIVRVFVAAGEGLAAAHHAGLIHRDFKPANIIAGADGRVRVIDFGLARVQDSTALDAPIERGVDSVDFDALTEVDAVVGTPPYMAPEQYRRERVDALTDQYGFCVSLFEALYGARPFRGRSRTELEDQVLEGDVVVPDGADVPSRLARIVRRGMSLDPNDRFESMDALLDELRADQSRGQRRLLAAAGLAGVALVVFVLVAWRGGAEQSAAERCESLRAGLDDVWNPEVAGRVAGKLGATEAPYAADVARHLVATLDGYARQWGEMRVEACAATRVRAVQSDELLDLRMACLDRRRDAVRAQVDVLLDPPQADAVERAAYVVARLPQLEPCADATGLRAEYPLPDDPDQRKAIAALRRELDHVRAMTNLGSYRDAVEPAEAAVEAARATDYPPVLAEALALAARAHELTGNVREAERTYEESLHAAAAAGNEALLAHDWIDYLDFIGLTLDRHDEALALVRAAEVAVAAAGESPHLRAYLLTIEGGLLESEGEYERARKTLTEALELREQSGASAAGSLETTLDLLAAVEKMLGEYAAAIDHQQRAVAVAEQTVGPRHPRYAALVFNLGLIHVASGDCETALAHFGRASEVIERAVGPDHPNLASMLSETANCLKNRGEYDGALEAQRRALAIRERSLGPDHPSVAYSLQYLGELLIALERYDEAAPLLERGLRVREAALPPNHPQIGESVAAIGELLWSQGKVAEARPYYERTRDIYAVAYGNQHPFYAVMLLNLGDCDLDLGDPARAVPNLERAVEVLRAGESAPSRIADAEFVLAKALWRSRRDRKRARSLARGAADVFRAAGDAEQADKIEAWLKQPR